MSRGTRRPAGGGVFLLVASGLAAAGLAVLALAGCGGSEPGAAATPVSASGGATRLAADFHHGIPQGWEFRRATIEDGAGHDPAGWVRLDATGVPAYVSLPPNSVAPGRRRYRFSGRFRVRTRAPGQSVGLATVENSAHEHHDDLFVDASSGRCRVDIFSADTAMSPGRCDDGAWHRVTMTGDFGAATSTLAWTVDGVRMPSIRSTGQPPATVHRLWLGDATPAKTNVTDWADTTLELH
jgi:hypothetical protein